VFYDPYAPCYSTCMKRREFITLLGGAAVAWPLAALAQRVYRLGFLTTTNGPAPGHETLEATLSRFGYREGVNLIIERRYAAGDLNRLPELAADLVRANVDVIVTQTTPASLAAKRATTKIPIVMATGGDAVGSGLVASLARPGGNVTGMTFMGTDIIGKRVELLRALKPEARRVAFLGNNQIIPEQLAFRDLQSTTASLGMDAIFVHAAVAQAFEPALATMPAAGVDLMMVAESAAYTDARSQIVALAARYRLPAAYGRREFADAGGLLSYGTNFPDLFRHAAIFVDKILKGANPAELPVEQPTKFELVINLKTAKALGLEVPLTLQVAADEVIE
jgi:putative ABC transport system substrate-binding protein